MEGYGLVLGGGGARGSYEIGVWKALMELEIPVNTVVGTSVGALNAAMIAQGDFETTYKYWIDLSTDSVITPEKKDALPGSEEHKKKYMEFIALAKQVVVSKGLDVTPLKELLSQLVDEDRVRRSQMDMGLVTFSLTDMKSIRVFKKDIPEGKLVDYLLASACFPAFKPQEIDDKLFIDGGVTDNLPISLMIEKGIKKIIAVDIEGPGIMKKFDDTGTEIVYIKPSENLGKILDFDGQKAKENIQMGYYDTLRKFGRYKGIKYYIKPDEDIEELKRKLVESISVKDLKKMYAYLGIDWASKPSATKKLVLQIIMRTLQTYTDGKLSTGSLLPAMAEIAAEQMGIDRKRPYSLSELMESIMTEYRSISESQDFKGISTEINSFIKSLNPIGRDREFKPGSIEEKFLVSYDANMNEKDEKVKKFRRIIAVAMPKICIANLLIALVTSKDCGINEK